jgi:hypothetical protein
MDTKDDAAQDKAMVGAGVNKHEKRLHPGKALTKFAKGGKTNAQMKSLGRNKAKIANQKKKGRK